MEKTFRIGRLRVTFGRVALDSTRKFVWVNTPHLTGRLRVFATRNLTIALWPRHTMRTVRAAFADAHEQYRAMA